MELSWAMLLLLIVILATIAFWHNSLGAREAANGAAQDTCAATSAALLNGTVAFHSMRVVRGDGGQPQLERTYLFDYSTDGATRRQGFVIVSGRRVESIGLQ